MNDVAVEALRVDPEPIERAVAFYRAYASTCTQEWRQARAVDGDVVGRRGATLVADGRLMEAASSLRKAGAWALLIDPVVGMSLLRESAAAYSQLRFGYGAFLAAMTQHSRSSQRPDELGDWPGQLASLLEWTARLQDVPRGAVDSPEPIRHPQQQVYAAIAASSAGPKVARLAQAIAERTDQRDGVLPVGALGTPIRRFWAVARGLLFDDMETAVDHITAMGERFSDQAESAMVNRALWRTGHADFEAVDLDVVGCMVLGFHTFGQDEMMRSLERRRVFDDRVAASLMLIAQDLHRPEPNGAEVRDDES